MEKKYFTELKIAEEFLESDKINVNHSLRTSANRLYFALEKAVSAFLLFKKRAVPKNHQKIWELTAELLGEKYYQMLRELYDLRMQADYGTMSIILPFNEIIVKEKLIEVESLVFDIKNMIKQDKTHKKLKTQNT